MEDFVARAENHAVKVTFSGLLLQALKHLKPELVAEAVEADGAFKRDDFNFPTRVMQLWEHSGLSVDEHFPKTKKAIRSRVTRNDSGAAELEKQYSTSTLIGYWYVARNLLIDRATMIFREAQPDHCKYAVSLIEEFCASIKNNHSISPFEATVFISVMQSFKQRANGDVYLHPGPLLLLCKLIVSREPANTSFAMMNWLNLLPDEEYSRVIEGQLIDLHPDNRILSLGSRVARITSFPLMPEHGIWKMEGWNTQMLNLHAPDTDAYGSASAASAKPPSSAPIPPFPVFKEDHRRFGGGAIVGIDEFNQVVDRIPSGAGVNKLSADGVIDLRPLARYIAQLIDAPRANNNNYRNNHNNNNNANSNNNNNNNNANANNNTTSQAHKKTV